MTPSGRRSTAAAQFTLTSAAYPQARKNVSDRCSSSCHNEVGALAILEIAAPFHSRGSSIALHFLIIGK
eukprot:4274388-Amphidinium_carterae.1